MNETKTQTLTEFLLARIAEDEAVARAVVDSHAMWDWESYVANAGMYDMPANEFATRHDPARVLAQCAALRAVVNEAAALLDSWDHVHEGTAGLAMWPDVNRRERSQAHRRLRALASIWSSHPDYPLED